MRVRTGGIAIAALALPFASVVHAQCAAFGDGTLCPLLQNSPFSVDIGANEAWVFQASVTGMHNVAVTQTCNSQCTSHGVQTCQPTAANPCPDDCFCANGNKVQFAVNADISSATKDLVFAVSESSQVPAPGAAAAALQQLTDGDWTVSGKQFVTEYTYNIGKGDHLEEFDLVELCYAAWAGNTVASWADAECGCSDCTNMCGLRGSRKATQCDDVDCSSDEGQDRCFESSGGSTSYDRCDGGLCDNQYSMQIFCPGNCGPPNDQGEPSLPPNNFNCTAYASSPGMAEEALFASYCCDMVPTAFEAEIEGLKKPPNKKSGAWFATGATEADVSTPASTATCTGADDGTGTPCQLNDDETGCLVDGGSCIYTAATPYDSGFSERCNNDMSSLYYGYETSFVASSPSVINCELPTEADGSSTYYLYVFNVGNTTISNVDLTWDILPISGQEGKDCAVASGWAPVTSGSARVDVVLALLASAVVMTVW